MIPESFKEKEKKRVEEARWKKKLKSGLRRCPGHWSNKGMGLRNKDCYDGTGRCFVCGGYKDP